MTREMAASPRAVVSPEEVFESLVQAVRDVCPRTAKERLTTETDLVIDAGLDSFELAEVLLLMESSLKLDVELDESLFEGVRSAGQLADRLASLANRAKLGGS